MSGAEVTPRKAALPTPGKSKGRGSCCRGMELFHSALDQKQDNGFDDGLHGPCVLKTRQARGTGKQEMRGESPPGRPPKTVPRGCEEKQSRSHHGTPALSSLKQKEVEELVTQESGDQSTGSGPAVAPQQGRAGSEVGGPLHRARPGALVPDGSDTRYP